MADPQTAEPGHSDVRREHRKSMFVMATLYAATGSAPVKVRDMSSGGALIEGGVIPPPGTNVRLCRGSLSVTGQVAWAKGGRAGLSFGSTVTPAEWLPTSRAPAPQQRVDEAVQQVKASMLKRTTVAAPVTLESAPVTALELTRLRRAIEELGDDLADDPAVFARHGDKLQVLDLTAQLLRKLAAQVH